MLLVELCAVETMDNGAFASYLSGRLSSIAGLSSGISDYDGKKAAGDDLTAERRANRLVRL